MYATREKKPKPELRGHNPFCIGLPDQPCGRPINTKTDYPSDLDPCGVMQYRCRACEERRVLREVRQSVRDNPKPLED